jgi:Zn-finger protein
MVQGLAGIEKVIWPKHFFPREKNACFCPASCSPDTSGLRQRCASAFCAKIWDCNNLIFNGCHKVLISLKSKIVSHFRARLKVLRREQQNNFDDVITGEES